MTRMQMEGGAVKAQRQESMNALTLKAALAARHSGDLFIAECKNGPTQSIGARPIRLDGWALLKTWSPVTSIGYEVKVSRRDFTNDHKCRDYLPLCHSFYFVTPKGLIHPDELTDGVGLLEAIGRPTAPRLMMRRKAQYRQPEQERYLSLLHYVLMCRVREGGTWVSTFDGRQEDPLSRKEREHEAWRAWLKAREDGKSLGERITQRVGDDMRRLQREIDQAQSLVRGYEKIRETLRSMGFDPDKPISEWRLERRLCDALEIIDQSLVESMMAARNQLSSAIEKIEHAKCRVESMSSTA